MLKLNRAAKAVEKMQTAWRACIACDFTTNKVYKRCAKAENELGDKFDIREFHNQVLETGSVPLALLGDKINRWIANSK